MTAKRVEEYVVYTVEYVVGVGKVNQPVYYVLGIYQTEEEANDRKQREEENALRLGYKTLKFYVEEIKVFDSKLEKKKTRNMAHEMQETKRRWWI
jgi:hypothetical protein